MPSLADTQRLMRNALVAGDTAEIEPFLTGGRHVARRLAIHQRHYETSLVTALLGKFPATTWLAGAEFVTDAAHHFVREHPPAAPCIAEYGEDFPRFLSTRPAAGRAPYLRPFATLEWHVGHVAVAIDRPPLTWDDVARISPDAVPDTRLTLQPGVRYLEAAWPVDTLMTLYLTDAAPDELALDPLAVGLELRGARGEFHFTRLDADDFAFRSAIAMGLSIGEAADAALVVDASFDAGQALARLVSESAVTRS